MKTFSCAVILAFTLGAGGLASAADKSDLSGAQQQRPWAVGVAPEDQKTALQLFREGNGLLKESVFVQAAQKYRDALKHWDHPAIHYNLVLALLNLDQPLEVHENLEAAMRYGAEPLDHEKFEQAKAYQSLVERQLAKVKLACSEPGASVTLDGQPLFSAPGKYEGYLRAGPHSLVATKPGFIPFELSRALPAGELTEVEIKLFTEDDLTQYRRKWSSFVPWSVVAAGVVVAGAGGLMHQAAVSSVRDYDAGINACGGCVPSADLLSKKTTGNTLQTASIVALAAGGATLVTGAVLVYVNRLQPYRTEQKVDLAVSPYAGPHEGGLLAQLRF
jgi:tetratricopeptide (TPR) repeat protein